MLSIFCPAQISVSNESQNSYNQKSKQRLTIQVKKLGAQVDKSKEVIQLSIKSAKSEAS